ncbi:MAG: HAMP domain-containing histidine kinase [Eubacterium sp.]|nr:HAMP domain-containing histidine kinase [Eubacterium sp.]
MKQISRIALLFTILMVGTLLLLIFGYKKNDYRGRDMAYYNDCLISLYSDYKAGLSEEELESGYNCDIVFSKEVVSTELTKYYSSGALVLDFAPDGEYLGKVVWNDVNEGLERVQRYTRRSIVLFWTAVLILGYILLFLVWFFLIRPVAELKNFSTEIAKGNLDVSLPIHKYNLFGSFTESFDIMREELRAAREREIEAGVAKKEMVAELSHDIKTPIATIQATCEVLDMKYRRKMAAIRETETADGRSEETAELSDTLEKVASISAKAETVNSLMNNVVHATLEELDRIEVNPVENSSGIIEEYFNNMKNSGSESAVILDNHIPKCLIYFDSLRMEQVIDNIIGNSRKYAGTDIHVSFDEVSGDYIRIRISDSGPGVPEDELPLITEKYFRGSSGKDRAGYGLGMYLVKLYMEKQGGGIEYYNDNGFTVELLLKKV